MTRDRIAIGLLLVLVLVIGTSAFYFLFTSKGVETIVRSAFSRHASKEDISFVSLGGNIVQGVAFNNIELKNLTNFPAGTILRIQKLFINLTSWGIEGLVIEVENGRLRLPDADPILVAGSFRDERLDFNIYAKGLAIENFLHYIPRDRRPPYKLTGTVDDIDLYIKGEYTSPEVTGEFTLNKVSYQGLDFKDGKGQLGIKLRDINDNVQVFGDILLETGSVDSKRTSVKLEKSSVYFSGPPENPSFDIKAGTNIEKVKIKIGLKGTLEEPELMLSSEPSLSREKIMLMLATGKSWKGFEESLDAGVISPNLTKDFIDYFIFAGKGNAFARQFGLNELSVDFGNGKNGISAKKSLTEKLEVGYGVNSKANGKEKPDVTQKLQGQYQVTGNISVGAEKDIKKKEKAGEFINEASKPETEDKVYLKYEKDF